MIDNGAENILAKAEMFFLQKRSIRRHKDHPKREGWFFV